MVPISLHLVTVDPDFRTTLALIVSSLTGLLSIVVTTFCKDFLEARREKRKRLSEYHNWLTQRYESDNLSNPQIAVQAPCMKQRPIPARILFYKLNSIQILFLSNKYKCFI